MKQNSFILIFILSSCLSLPVKASALTVSDEGRFDIEKDLLLAQFDCKTDVDDLHTVAALTTLLADPKYSELQYHAVAGTYGVQKGLYVPPNDLFQLAFGDNWTDAHENVEAAVNQVKAKVKATLAEEGNIWIAEAGQSDFTAALIKAIQADLPELNIAQRIHVVQHSDWNEKSTSEESLQFVKEHTEYHKIPDGNATDNGTPGFRSAETIPWQTEITDPQLTAVWELAIALSNMYNGKDERYNNKAIAAGGLDFSDLSEVCWILGTEDIKDATEFFSLFAR